ncbi:MAG: hypothetical protein AAF943_15125 [Pseudomonadota bacterium]
MPRRFPTAARRMMAITALLLGQARRDTHDPALCVMPGFFGATLRALSGIGMPVGLSPKRGIEIL